MKYIKQLRISLQKETQIAYDISSFTPKLRYIIRGLNQHMPILDHTQVVINISG